MHIKSYRNIQHMQPYSLRFAHRLQQVERHRIIPMYLQQTTVVIIKRQWQSP